MADLLQPTCHMPVIQINETMPLEPDHVYIISPGKNLSSIDTHLRVTQLEQERRERAPIDHFFETLARTHQEKAIGIILSGTGFDGALGLKRIKENSGLTIVQEPNEAEFDGMPQSAIATGLIDLILPIKSMPKYLLRYAKTQPRLPLTEATENMTESIKFWSAFSAYCGTTLGTTSPCINVPLRYGSTQTHADADADADAGKREYQGLFRFIKQEPRRETIAD